MGARTGSGSSAQRRPPSQSLGREEKTDDDVSLFLLTEFVVHAHVSGEDETVAAEDIAATAEAVEAALTQAEEIQDAEESETHDVTAEELVAVADEASAEDASDQQP